MIQIPRQPDVWLLSNDGSAMPLNSFLVEQDLEDIPRRIVGKPKVKAGYTVAKASDWR